MQYILHLFHNHSHIRICTTFRNDCIFIWYNYTLGRRIHSDYCSGAIARKSGSDVHCRIVLGGGPAKGWRDGGALGGRGCGDGINGIIVRTAFVGSRRVFGGGCSVLNDFSRIGLGSSSIDIHIDIDINIDIHHINSCIRHRSHRRALTRTHRRPHRRPHRLNNQWLRTTPLSILTPHIIKLLIPHIPQCINHRTVINPILPNLLERITHGTSHHDF
mmetsp:Transcript_14575/g.31696  ORF Transcript_14575/g.31696 Transcript_14575/m.31696 type:complete len:217 (-) Transcript_14575:1689-2339(-)